MELPRRKVLRSDRTKGESPLKLVFFDRPRNLRASTVKSVRVQRLCVGSRRKRSTTSLEIWVKRRNAYSVSTPDIFSSTTSTGTSRVRVEDSPRTHKGSTPPRCSDDAAHRQSASEQFRRTDHLLVGVRQ